MIAVLAGSGAPVVGDRGWGRLVPSCFTRQQDLNDSTLTRCAGDPDGSVVAADDAVNNRQTQAVATASFGGEEQIKDSGLHVG